MLNLLTLLGRAGDFDFPVLEDDGIEYSTKTTGIVSYYLLISFLVIFIMIVIIFYYRTQCRKDGNAIPIMLNNTYNQNQQENGEDYYDIQDDPSPEHFPRQFPNNSTQYKREKQLLPPQEIFSTFENTITDFATIP